jgi:hypothetical protein
MRFYESGEGHFSLEGTGDNLKLWLESGGNYTGQGSTISCVDWSDGTFYEESYGNTYNLGNLSGTRLTIDENSGLILVYDEDNKQYLVYDREMLSEDEETPYLSTIQCAKDQTPAYGADESNNHYSASVRGFALADGYIYQISGGTKMYVSVFDLSGTLIYCRQIEEPKTTVTTEDGEEEEDANYFPAAIAVRKGVVYLGIRSGTDTRYLANVWKMN